MLVVANNQGGGIFSFLAQASALAPERFEQLFATPHSHDLVAVAKAFGHASEMVTTPAQLRTAIDTGVAEPGLSVIVARVRSREENVRHHAELNDAVHQVWRAGAT